MDSLNEPLENMTSENASYIRQPIRGIKLGRQECIPAVLKCKPDLLQDSRMLQLTSTGPGYGPAQADQPSQPVRRAMAGRQS